MIYSRLADSRRARIVVFVWFVVVLVLAVVLMLRGQGSHSAAPTPGWSAAHVSMPTGQGQSTAPVTNTGTPTGSNSRSVSADAGNLPLPVSREELNQAGQTAVDFVTAQNTYRYDTDVTTWAAELAQYTTTSYAATVQASLPSRQQVAEWKRTHLVSRGYAEVSKVYLLSQQSIVLFVESDQKVTTTAGTQSTTDEWSVTLVPGPQRHWSISSVLASDLGNN